MNQAISRLPIPAESELPEDIQQLFQQMREKPGFVPHVFRGLSLRPEQLRGFVALYNSIMESDSGLSKAEREMIAVTVSSLNHCLYCLVSHGAVLRIRTKDEFLAETIAANYHVADLSPRQHAMLAFAAKMTLHSAQCSPDDIEALRQHGFAETDIMDIIQTAAFFNYSNRMSSALGLRPNLEYLAMGRKKSETA